MGAPIDPRTQRIMPGFGATDKVETWVSFIIEGYGANGAAFCLSATHDTLRIVTAMSEQFQLS
jgi:hypothetical protein